ncbi:MAG: redoxin domain-containing protein [Rickettsiales bacterium]|jgi:peroxiredoxin|nr:redoxin domain-containing protein [Rickettsiales bacterium]
MRSLLLSIVASFALTSQAIAAPAVGKPAPDFTAKDITGKEVKLSALKDKIVVLEWHNPGCPFVEKFYGGGDMQKLQADMKAAGAVWISINSGAEGKQGHLKADDAAKLLAEQKSATDHYIIDDQGTIGKLYDAKTTPHMFVVDAKGMIAYMGAIDDKPTTKSSDIAGAKNYVREAVAALKEGKPVAVSSTDPYGCGVKYKD